MIDDNVINGEGSPDETGPEAPASEEAPQKATDGEETPAVAADPVDPPAEAPAPEPVAEPVPTAPPVPTTPPANETPAEDLPDEVAEETSEPVAAEPAEAGEESAGEESAGEEPAQAEPAPAEISIGGAVAAAAPVANGGPDVSVNVTHEALEEEDDKESEDGEEERKPVIPELDEERSKLPWYVVHTYSGFENQVKASLEERIKLNDLTHRFGNVLVPQETVVELVRGQKKTSTRKFLPGYIVVQMDLDEETWHLVRETPKVTGFVGDSTDPAPLSPPEVQNLVAQMEGGAERPRPKVQFEEGDAIKVVDGPFADFNGTVEEVKPDKGKLRVLISIFGRNTPVELDFVQVEKA